MQAKKVKADKKKLIYPTKRGLIRLRTMLIRYFAVLLLISFSQWAHSQSIIEGQVLDAGEEGLGYADIILHETSDSSIVTATQSDIDGKFSLSAKPGTYLIQVRMLSFQTEWTEPIQIQSGRQNLGRIKLESSSATLDEIIVAEDKNQMELKLDRRVYQVDKDLANVGGNAVNILENLPSVTVDVEGNVSLRGSENVRILINGKPSGLLGSDNQGLRQIQASMIERVEVITNPSAKYEAEGEAGIINIVLKKQTEKGINGSIDVSAGYPDQLGLGINLNRRKEKFNLFTNLGINYRKTIGGGDAKVFFYQEDTTIFETERDHVRSSKSATIQVGGDYFFNPKSTLTVSGTYRLSEGNHETEINYRDLNQIDEIIGRSTRLDKENEIGNEIEVNLNYKSTFSSKDHFLDINLAFQDDGDEERSDIDQDVLDGMGMDLEQRSDNIEDEQRTIFSMDYEHPFGEGKHLELGTNFSFRFVDNHFLVETLNDQGQWEVDDFFNNQMEYRENIHAGYGIFASEQKEWSYQFGLRAEYSDISTRLIRTDEENPRNYLDLFPSAHFSWNVNEKNQLQLSYSRRISRPRFRHLLPFYSFSDNRNYWGGNPNLNPEYSNNVDLGLLRFFEKGSLLTSLYYRYRTDIIQRITFINDDDVTQIIPVNLGIAHAGGLELSLNYNLYEWLRITGNLNVFHLSTSGQYEGEDLSATTLTMNTRWSVRAQLSKGWTLQSSVNYLAPENRPQGKRLGFYSCDVGFSKELLNKQATLTFGIRDVFNTRVWMSETIGEDFYRESAFQWRIRSFNLSFNYLINRDPERSGRRQRGFQGGGDGEGF